MGLNREELAAAPHARLHFVGDQYYAMPPRFSSQSINEFKRQVVGARDALHRLEDDGRNA